ncbi:MAG TPA: hypothetical protein VK869_12330 [Rubrobacteraceae bacterium]|nr:hypothetical protein [Rubrobacteraceae bacterium]
MIEWLKTRSSLTRASAYAAATILAFALATGVGATAALMIQGGPFLPTRGSPGPAGERGDASDRSGEVTTRLRQEETTSGPKDAAPRQDEAEYEREVGEIQAGSVETFLDTHGKLLRYDALTAADVEEMQDNQDTLQRYVEQAGELDPPQKYREQHEVFRSAVDELNEAARLAHDLAADPTTATQSGFEEYDRHVDEAAAYLQRSNEALDRDYKTIEGLQEVNPLS